MPQARASLRLLTRPAWLAAERALSRRLVRRAICPVVSSPSWPPPVGLVWRTVLVTGGATGIGAEIGRALAAAGSTVAVNHLGQDSEAHALLAAFERDGSPGIAVNADLTDPIAVQTTADLVRAEIGPVDILVNNAGSYPGVPWQETDEAAWNYFLDVTSPPITAPATP